MTTFPRRTAASLTALVLCACATRPSAPVAPPPTPEALAAFQGEWAGQEAPGGGRAVVVFVEGDRVTVQYGVGADQEVRATLVSMNERPNVLGPITDLDAEIDVDSWRPAEGTQTVQLTRQIGRGNGMRLTYPDAPRPRPRAVSLQPFRDPGPSYQGFSTGGTFRSQFRYRDALRDGESRTDALRRAMAAMAADDLTCMDSRVMTLRPGRMETFDNRSEGGRVRVFLVAALDEGPDLAFDVSFGPGDSQIRAAGPGDRIPFPRVRTGGISFATRRTGIYPYLRATPGTELTGERQVIVVMFGARGSYGPCNVDRVLGGD